MTVGPTAALTAVFAVAALCIILMTANAVRLQHRPRQAVVLTPVDEDDDPGHSVWIVTVRYQSSGTAERLVIVDDDQRSTHDARHDIEDTVQGVDVIEIERVPLFAFDPVPDR